MSRIVYIVDDERDIRELIQVNLEGNGFQVEEFAAAGDFFEALKERIPSVVILDLMLPDEDGIEICRKIRRTESTKDLPVIMLTARIETIDKVIGLEVGADDYITKPFSPRELIARVKAVLRRTENAADISSEDSSQIKVKDLVLDAEEVRVTKKGEQINLTHTEFRILELLMRNRGKVYSRERILDHLWGDEKYVVDRTIDVHIRHLRKKLAEYAGYIQNIRGAGYRFEKD